MNRSPALAVSVTMSKGIAGGIFSLHPLFVVRGLSEIGSAAGCCRLMQRRIPEVMVLVKRRASKGSGSKRRRLQGSDARVALAVALRLGVAVALRQSRLTVCSTVET